MAGENWLEGWDYRKYHVINPQAGAGTNYQMKIIVYYGAGTDSQGTVYLNSKCKTDFGDIRFTDDNGNTLLDYWMEEKVDSSYAIFWVEIADSLESNPVTIYVYYGNADVTTTSNGFNTWDFFDDFNDNDWTDKWTRLAGTWSEAGGVLSQTVQPLGTPVVWMRGIYTIANPAPVSRRVMGKVRLDDTSGNRYASICSKDDGGANVVGSSCLSHQFRNETPDVLRDQSWIAGSIGIAYNSAVTINLLTWYKLEVLLTGSTVKTFVDNVAKGDFSDNSWNQNFLKVSLGFFSSKVSFDDICVGKFTDPEPVHSTWGEEEELVGIITQAATEITINSAKLNASATTAGIEIVERGFDWGTETGVYTDEWTEEGSWTENFSFDRTITPLIQGTTYYFRAKIKDSDGTLYYGGELSFSTLIRLIIEARNLSENSLVVDITVDGTPQTTSYSEDFEVNDVVTVVVTQSEPFTQGGYTYKFKKWENDSTNKTRNITMTGTSTITVIAYFSKLFYLAINSIATGTEFDLSVGGG